MLVGARSFGRIAAMRLTAARSPKRPPIFLAYCYSGSPIFRFPRMEGNRFNRASCPDKRSSRHFRQSKVIRKWDDQYASKKTILLDSPMREIIDLATSITQRCHPEHRLSSCHQERPILLLDASQIFSQSENSESNEHFRLLCPEVRIGIFGTSARKALSPNRHFA